MRRLRNYLKAFITAHQTQIMLPVSWLGSTPGHRIVVVERRDSVCGLWGTCSREVKLQPLTMRQFLDRIRLLEQARGINFMKRDGWNRCRDPVFSCGAWAPFPP